MDGLLLEPWMLRTDWRADARPCLLVDLAAWPPDQPLDPRPPVPLIGIGSASHPQAPTLDLLVEPPFDADRLCTAIARTPQAAATLVQLLRLAETLPPDAALTAESFAFAMLQAGGEHTAWRAARPPSPALPPGTLHLRRAGRGLDLRIDRPAAHNAIDRAMRDALFEAFQLAALDDGVDRIRLRAAGRCFSMGADLAEFGSVSDAATAHAIRMRSLPARALLPSAAMLDVHVQGGCVGAGLELAAFAGRLTAAPDAWFQFPETAMGILPGAGGTVSVPRRIGRRRAALLMLSGRRIDARRAHDWGLIDAIMDEDAVDDRRADVGTGRISG